MVGIKRENEDCKTWSIEHTDAPYGDKLKEIEAVLKDSECIVGHNLKFDLHWVRRYCPDYRPTRVHDTQLAEFLLSHQSEAYPSLDECCSKRGLGNKLDHIYTNYWSIGLDTTAAPADELETYLRQDCVLTEKLYLQQQQEVPGSSRILLLLQNADLLVLQEMEFNGMCFDYARAAELSTETQSKITALDAELFQLAGCSEFNPDSTDDLSCVLYGGFKFVKVRETYDYQYKDGSIKQKERWGNKRLEFQPLVQPLERSECKPTAGLDEESLQQINQDRERNGLLPFSRHYSVSEHVLKRLRPKGRGKRIVEIILERAYLHKLDSTYYRGLIELKAQRGWKDDRLFGNFNQVVARTGRLSSSGPNLQNFSGDIKELFYSRYS